jgi:hypothetical protein
MVKVVAKKYLQVAANQGNSNAYYFNNKISSYF